MCTVAPVVVTADRKPQGAALVGQEEGRTRTREERTWTLLGISAQLGTSLPSRKSLPILSRMLNIWGKQI